ncbi:beta-lactamase family protein [Ruania sp. N2-46]|uniref:Beta-lactamase family protein n=1 Tax=Occultella gossypii TaxID=2800820 RepID=A0ABS7SIF7_9MICO|nr:beta-lactamase family protein [Occultella gossypii]
MRRRATTRVSAAAVLVAVSASLLVGCGPGGPDTIAPFVAETVPADARGVVVAAQADDLVLCEGWGSADETGDVAFGCDTVVDVMSMTKQFTAAAVLRLQMLGELDVSDPIGTYLDAVPEDKQGITIEHLLTHTSGLVDGLGDDYDPVGRDDLIDAAMDSVLQSTPGTSYAYSNLGYGLLAAIIEIASGTGYEQFLAEHLFGPAGMTSTGYVLPDWSRLDVAVEFDDEGNPRGRPIDHPWAEDGPYWNLRGNGGLLSTARDMFRWHLALRGDDVLDDAAKAQLFEPRVREEPDDTYYGYGWVITDHDDEPVAWHNGGNSHAYGELARTPDGSAMLFWTTTQAASRDGWTFEDLGPELTDGILQRLL